MAAHTRERDETNHINLPKSKRQGKHKATAPPGEDVAYESSSSVQLVGKSPSGGLDRDLVTKLDQDSTCNNYFPTWYGPNVAIDDLSISIMPDLDSDPDFSPYMASCLCLISLTLVSNIVAKLIDDYM